MKRKIAIIGSSFHIRSVEIILSLENYERWSMNNLWLSYPVIKFDRWFELHKFERIGFRYYRRGQTSYNQFSSIADYMASLNRLNIPIYMQRKWKNIRKAMKFPFQKIIDEFKTEYFGCSFAWMIGLALLEHLHGSEISEIALVGTTLSGQEYYFQRPSTEYFLGMAKGMGIDILNTETSNILKAPYIYAFKEDKDIIDLNYVSATKEIMAMIAIPIQELFEKIHYEGTPI